MQGEPHPREAQTAPTSSPSSRTPSTSTSRPTRRPSARPPPSGSLQRARVETFVDLVGATVHEITLNGTAVRPTTYARQPDRAVRRPPTTGSWSADCAYSRSGETCTASSTPPTTRICCIYLAVRGPGRPARVHHVRAARPEVGHTFNVTAPAHWKVVSNAPTPSRARPATAWPNVELPGHQAHVDLHRASPVSTTRCSTPTRAIRRDPLGHYCRQSLVPSTSARGAGQADQAGLRVLRGGLRLSLPVREVRPALRVPSTTWARWRTPAT